MENEENSDDEVILPFGWTAHVDPTTGHTYYYHLVTGATQWNLPRWQMDSAAGGGGGAAVYNPPPQPSDDAVVGPLYSPRGPSPRNDAAAAGGWGALLALFGPPAAAAPAAAAPAAAGRVMPADVARYAIDHASGDCPIAWTDLNSLPRDKKAVTNCGHVFSKDEIAHVKSLGGVCPTCRSNFKINPILEADVVGPTFVPTHMKKGMVVRAIFDRKVPLPLHTTEDGKKISESAYHMCDRCGNVVDRIPVPNQCPKCQKMGAFLGGSRKHKRNIHRKSKSKKLIKRKKTMKRR